MSQKMDMAMKSRRMIEYALYGILRIMGMRAIMKYPGSKWSIAEWIISFFPDHHSYLEAFLGSGAVLFNKSRSNIETVNDLDGNVINLFEWIKNDPEKLAQRRNNLLFTGMQQEKGNIVDEF